MMSTVVMVSIALSAGLIGVVIAGLFLRKWPTLPMALLLLGIYTNRYKWNVGPVNVRIEQVIFLSLAVLIVVRWAWRGEAIRVPIPLAYAGGWWLSLALAALLNAPEPGAIARHVIRLGIMVVAFLVTVNLLERQSDWHTLVRWLFVIGVLEATWGLVARAVYAWDFGTVSVAGVTLQSPLNLGIQITTSLPVPVPYGTIEEGNIFGSTMGALLVLALGLWTHPEARVSRRWVGIGIALVGGAWIVSLARGAWLSVLLVLPLFWVLYPRSSEQRFVHLGALLMAAPLGLAALALAMFLLPPTSPIVARLQTLTQLGADPTFGLRMERWIIAWEDIRLHPFVGWGPGTFEQLHGIQRFALAWLDSLTIKTLQEAGLFGLIFFYAFWASILGEGIHAILTGRAGESRGALLGLTLGGLVLFLAYHATDATWLGYMWVWLGITAAHPNSIWMHYEPS